MVRCNFTLMKRSLLKISAGTLGAGLLAGVVLLTGINQAQANPDFWKFEWPKTNFKKKTEGMAFSEIFSGGPPKDGIPSIDNPKFKSVKDVDDLPDTVPVIGFSMNGDARAYPLGILMRHEIVNDTVGGVPVAVTNCPLCNSAVVFDARIDGKVHEFGTTGKLRNSDLVMYDRVTESWWQQFLGEAIVGDYTGKVLKAFPARLESYGNFKKRFPDGKLLRPAFPFMGAGGANPYRGYDTSPRPFLFRGPMPEGIEPLARVVKVGKQGWSMELLRKKKRIEAGDLVLTWTAGQNSALDTGDISRGRDVGNVVVQRKTDKGLVDEVYDVTFAFTFNAFHGKDGKLHLN